MLPLRSPLSLFCALLALAACQGAPACGGDRLAELIEAHGQVQRDFADRPSAWQTAEIGAKLRRGDGLRTGPKATAVLSVGRGGTLRVESDTTLRLTLPGDQVGSTAPEIEVETGQALLEAGGSPLPIATSSGSAVLRAGSRVALSRAQRGVRYEVVIGGAAFKQADGKTSEVGAGQSIVVGIGMAVLDAKSQAQPTLAAVTPAAALRASAADAGTVQGSGGAKETDRAGAVEALVNGPVRRRAHGGRDWAELERGVNALGAGDELEVGKAGRAELTRGDERATLSQGRYEIGAADAPLVRARDGKLLVSAERIPVAVIVPGGTIIVQAAPSGSRADIAVDGEHGTTEIDVLSGQVKTAGAEGETLLEAGEQGRLGASTAGSSKRPPEVSRRADQPELVVRAGESFRLYDPSPPSAIGFSLGKRCPGGAELRIEGMEAVRGKRQINVLVGPGLRGYRVYCISGGEVERRASITSSLRVLRSDGTRRPPTSAARNNVDLDGRNYTLMYQNLRPILSVRWPDAPNASGYTLRLERPDGSVTSVRAKQPRATLEPHQLADGVHKLRFETAGGGAVASSKQTRVNLLFDNAAPTASLQQPPPAGFALGDSVPLSGVAVAGSTASIGARSIALDRAGRFSTQVQLKPGQRTIAIRFRHPKHGIRYYLRRGREGEP